MLVHWFLSWTKVVVCQRFKYMEEEVVIVLIISTVQCKEVSSNFSRFFEEVSVKFQFLNQMLLFFKDNIVV